MANVLFKIGSFDTYNALPTKDSNVLYFTTDTLQIFKGEKEYTKSVQLVSTLPSTGIQGIVYVDVTKFTLHAWNGISWVALTKGYATTIEDTATDINVPTSKAVKDYVTAKIAGVVGGDGVFVTDVTYTSGNLEIKKGNDTYDVALNGIIHEPTYDAETRKITLPVFGGDALEINLGKDLVVSSGSYNSENKSIELTLTSGDKVVIPVGSLIDIYIGVATSSTTVTVSDNNEISVAVKVSATADNAITIEEDGLYVPLSDAYTKAQTDEKIKAVNDALSGHTGNADIHVTAGKKAEWDAKATTAQVATAKQEAMDAASADATSKANQALADAKTYADGLNTAMNERMTVVENSVTWGTLA